MKRHVAVIALVAFPLLAAGRAARAPNILFLLTDDQRWDALSCTGNAILRTPNIDRLAAQGTLFTNAFVTSPVCCTSRASIVTGQWERRHGVSNFSTPIPAETFAESYPILLRQAGYRTGFVGKWGIGGEPPRDAFDFWRGHWANLRTYMEEGQPHWTRRVEARALRFLDGCSDDRPFFLQVAFQAPHGPLEPDPAYAERYRTDAIPRRPTATEEAFHRLPAFLQESNGGRLFFRRFGTEEKAQESVRNYYRLINGVDDAIGRILARLEERGWLENTVVIFSSDNGLLLGDHGLWGKWFLYEESIRVPLMISDYRLEQRKRGKRRDSVALNVDLAPTILTYAGLRVPDHVQGRSLRKLVGGGRGARGWRTDWYLEHHLPAETIPRSEGVRTPRWKYVRYIDSRPLHEELFDLRRDPFEEVNLATDPGHAGRLDRLRKRLAELKEETR